MSRENKKSNSIKILNFSQHFLNKEQKIVQKCNKIPKKIGDAIDLSLISRIFAEFCQILFVTFIMKVIKPIKDILNIKYILKLLKNPKNSSIVPFLWLNIFDFFIEVCLKGENEIIDQGRSYYQMNINISYCFFTRYSQYIGNGGVIFVEGNSYSMNIVCSMFYNCFCSNHGGAIFFNSSNSYLRMICSNACSCGASYYDNFAYIQAFQMNQIEYLSASYCSHFPSGYSSFCIESGNQGVCNTNSSMNKAYRGAGIFISSSISFTSSYCTFSNNNVSNSICICFFSESGTISMSNANIVNNNSPLTRGIVFVYGAGSRMMMYCIFYNNQNKLFCIASGSLEVSNSFIYHSESFSTRTAVSTSINNSFTRVLTYQIEFFNSHHCNADMPVPHISLERTTEKIMARTYDLKCEMMIFSSDGINKKRDINIIPIIISFLIL